MKFISIKIKDKKALRILNELKKNGFIDFALPDKPLTHFASQKTLAQYWTDRKEDKAWNNL